jgi:hypothetical protein
LAAVDRRTVILIHLPRIETQTAKQRRRVSMGFQMRKCIGAALCVIGISFGVFLLQAVWRIGFWDAMDGAKGGVYCWVVTAGVFLPITSGIALFCGVPGWRTFVGAWLIFAGLLVFGSLLFFVRDYRIYPDILLWGGLCGLPPILGGLFLLLRRNREKAARLAHKRHERDTDG